MKKKTKKVKKKALTEKQKRFNLLLALVRKKLITHDQLIGAILYNQEIEIALDHEFVTGFGGKGYLLP